MLDTITQDQEVTLQPVRLGMLNCIKHLDIDTFDTEACIHGFGVATDEEKQSALEVLISEGDQLNEKYFLGVPTHELWIDQKLVGLCQFNSFVSECKDSTNLHAFLDAIFLLKGFRGRGLSRTFVDCIWSSMVSEFMYTIHQAKLKGTSKLQVTLHADFESEEGEEVFIYLYDVMNNFFQSAGLALGVSIQVTSNAGY